MTAAAWRITERSLRRFYARVFEATGMSVEDSDLAARALVFADVRGVVTHGAANLERIYVSRLLDGRIDPRAEPRLASDRGAAATLDGNRGIGFVVAHRAMRQAVERARRFGVGGVGARNSTHCGGMAFYTREAADAGMIGLAFTNLGAQGILRPPGGSARLVGTNVVAGAAPAGDHPAFSLDMSAAVVSTGRLRAAARQGDRLPAGWLVGDDGEPVHDAGAYFDGSAHLQFLGGDDSTGGYKGYGLALLADMLCGILTGGHVGPNADALHGQQLEDAGVGHFMIAIDIAAFRPLDDFRRDLDEMLGTLMRSPARRPGGRVGYPGLEEEARASGGVVTLSRELGDSLESVARRLAIAPPAIETHLRDGESQEARG